MTIGFSPGIFGTNRTITNGSSYSKIELPNKVALVEALLPKAFEWARAAKPKQPLTCGVWKGDWSSNEKLTEIEKTQLEMSDVISFHNYDAPEEFEKRIQWLQAVQPAAPLHGVHGSRKQEHVSGSHAGREGTQCRGDQLGTGARQDADALALGFVEAAVYGS